MPYESYWISEPYIYATDFTGPVTVEEFDAVMRDYLGAVRERFCYFLLDMTFTESFPDDLFELDSMDNVVAHDNTRWFAVINPDVFANYTTRLLVRDKAKIFENRERAVGFLRGMVQLDTGLVV